MNRLLFEQTILYLTPQSRRGLLLLELQRRAIQDMPPSSGDAVRGLRTIGVSITDVNSDGLEIYDRLGNALTDYEVGSLFDRGFNWTSYAEKYNSHDLYVWLQQSWSFYRGSTSPYMPFPKLGKPVENLGETDWLTKIDVRGRR
jgi:hypothetical protein